MRTVHIGRPVSSRSSSSNSNSSRPQLMPQQQHAAVRAKLLLSMRLKPVQRRGVGKAVRVTAGLQWQAGTARSRGRLRRRTRRSASSCRRAAAADSMGFCICGSMKCRDGA